MQPGQIKILADPLSTLLEDSFEGARNEAAMCLGTLMKMVGERPLNAFMDGLADVRKVKVKEAYEKATVKCKAGGSGPSKPPPAAKEGPKKPPSKPATVEATTASKPSTEDVSMEEPPSKPKGKPPTGLMVCWRVLELVSDLIVTLHRRRKAQREQFLLLVNRPALGMQVQPRRWFHPLQKSHPR